MKTVFTIQGRGITADDLTTIREIIANNPDWHRTRIFQELCRRWNWVNDKGILKDLPEAGDLFWDIPLRSAQKSNAVPYLPDLISGKA